MKSNDRSIHNLSRMSVSQINEIIRIIMKYFNSMSQYNSLYRPQNKDRSGSDYQNFSKNEMWDSYMYIIGYSIVIPFFQIIVTAQVPTSAPIFFPPTTRRPNPIPTYAPSKNPSVQPITISPTPSSSPSYSPSYVSTFQPTDKPSFSPTLIPSCLPSVEPITSPPSPTVPVSNHNQSNGNTDAWSSGFLPYFIIAIGGFIVLVFMCYIGRCMFLRITEKSTENQSFYIDIDLDNDQPDMEIEMIVRSRGAVAPLPFILQPTSTKEFVFHHFERIP